MHNTSAAYVLTAVIIIIRFLCPSAGCRDVLVISGFDIDKHHGIDAIKRLVQCAVDKFRTEAIVDKNMALSFALQLIWGRMQ